MEYKTGLELSSMALASSEWAPFVAEIWDRNQQLWFSSNLVLPEPAQGDQCITYTCNMHTVTLPQDDNVPCYCSCNEYTTALIPCPCMVAVCQKHYGSWKSIQYLPSQWHLAKHPWHPLRQAIESDCTGTGNDVMQEDGMGADVSNELYASAFRATVVPDTKWFGTELRQHIERIITFVKRKEDFQHCVATLTVLEHRLENVTPGAAREPRVVNARVEPAKKIGTKKKPSKNLDEHPAGPAAETNTSGTSSKQKRQAASTTQGPKQKRAKTLTNLRIGEQCDSVIRSTIRANGGIRDGLVVEVEPDANAKSKSERWFMTVVDGRLKHGTSSNAALLSCRYMKTGSTTAFFEDARVVRTCKVDSILSVVMPVDMFPQAQIRGEKWENSRCIFNIRFLNSGACPDIWLDGTQVNSLLMLAWIKSRPRSGRTLTPHEYNLYPFQCYFPK